jgi:hypothetical protein
VEATFDGGHVSSDGGALLLREVDTAFGVVAALARCFTDRRDPDWVEFSVEELLRQRIFGLALGYEDINDHDRLRHDPLLALAAGRADVQGHDRRAAARDFGKPLAGKSTLNRVERAADVATANPRVHKVVVDPAACDDLLVDLYVARHRHAPREVIIDIDASDIELHGEQQGRFYHGYYGHYCYLPQYYFIGPWPVGVRLRDADCDAADGCIEELDALIRRLRARWPGVRVIVRADSGFARDEIMAWCEDQRIDFIFGLARNDRLLAAIEQTLAQVRSRVKRFGGPARQFRELRWRTKGSWSCVRRVVAKVEVLEGKDNPRFVVTSLPTHRWGARALYEDLYCARGEMENHIKEQQLDLFGTRASTASRASNQLRLYFSAFAHLLLVMTRHAALGATAFANATAGTIRSRLLKVGAVLRVSARRVHIAFSQAFPNAPVLRTALEVMRGPPA